MTPPARKPRGLNEGCQIAIVAPARPSSAELVPAARSYLQKRGYRVTTGNHLFDSYYYLAGRDVHRAQDLMAAFEDPDVDGIICARGGYGSGRMLALLDYERIASNPKILVGFSDTPALQLALYHRAALISFSGALADIDLSRATVDPLVEESLWLALTARAPLGDLGGPLRILRKGNRPVVGPLIPANLAVLCSLIGTTYMPDLSGSILLLEDVDEYPYRIDRMLNQLRLAEILPKLSGLVLGDFRDCFEAESANGDPDLQQLAMDATEGLDLTVAMGFPYGHHASRMVTPLGVNATIDMEERILKVTEAALE